MSNKEKKCLFLAITLVIFFTTLPNIYGWIISNSEYTYLGLPANDFTDKSQYLSWVEQVRSNKSGLFIKNLFTSEEGSGIFSPLWYSIGLFARLMHLPSVMAFHIFRIIFLIFFLLSVYYLLIKKIITDYRWRLITILILSFSSGFGSLLVLFVKSHYLSTDIWHQETNTFLTLNNSPLRILSQLSMVLFFSWLISRLTKAKIWETLLIALGLLLAGFIHPYTIIIIYCVSLVWCMILFINKKMSLKEILKLIIIIFISSWSLIYFYLLINLNQTFIELGSNCEMFSPPIIYYFTGFGLTFVLFILGLKKALKSSNYYLKFLLIWVLTTFIIIYLPVDFQRRLVSGLHIPIVLIGCWWLSNHFKYESLKNKSIFSYLLIFFFPFLLFLTTISKVSTELNLLKTKRYPLFIDKNIAESFTWLKNQKQSQANIILSSEAMSINFPYLSLSTTYLGTGCLTKDYNRKLIETEYWFFANNDEDDLKYQWLIINKINFIYYGPGEKKLGDFKPEQKDYLKPIFANNEITIYQVN